MQELALMMTADRVDPDEEEFTRLVKLAKGGDSRAFEVIVLRHERRVLSAAMHLLGSPMRGWCERAEPDDSRSAGYAA